MAPEPDNKSIRPMRKQTNGLSKNNEGNDSNMEVDEGGTYVGGIYIPPPFIPACSMESNGPRTIISNIIIENFKSYFGCQKISPLHQNFTAVIGPNGSGKSNVIDAMLFVFGYRASNIRTKKLSSLIHNSSRHQQVNSCSVAVTFQSIVDKDDGSYEAIGDEIVIKRTAFKDNSSFYSINGKKTIFKEIANLLGGYGIDLNSNRFLILQGEVEQISLMKPKALNEHDRGMLEYLEDIIGTSRFKEPLAKMSEKFDEMAEEHQQKLNRVKLLQRELKDLDGPKNAAVQFLKSKNELIQLENKQYQHHKMEIENKLDKFNGEKNKIEENLKTIDISTKELNDEKSAQDKEMRVASKALSELKKRKEAVDAEFEQANNRDMSLQAELQQTNKQRKKFMETLASEKNKLTELEQLPEKNSLLIEECSTKLERLEKDKQKLEVNYQSSKHKYEQKNQAFVAAREDLSAKLAPLKQVEAELLSKLNEEKTKMNLLQSDENKQKSRLDDLKTKLETMIQEMETKTIELKTLTQSKPALERSMQSSQQELNQLKDRESIIVPKIYSITSQLSEGRAAMQESNSQNKVLNFLMKQKAQGMLPGLFGRLGDLGGIDEKYNIAISTACGPLDNIVVDTMDTAQKGLQLLKDNNVGRTTFIALDKQEHLWQHIRTKFQSPENVPRLFDLVHIKDDRLKPAFYYALRDTLVGADLEQCTRLAYGAKRFRMVSLKGELIELSGAMSGGGKSVSRNRMGSSVKTNTSSSNIAADNPADLRNLEVMREQLQNELDQNHSRQTELELSVEQASNQLKNFETNCKKLSLEINSLKEQRSSMLQTLDEQREKVANTHSDLQKVQKLQKEIDKIQLAYERAVKDSQMVLDEVKVVDEKMNDLKKNLLDVVEKEIKNVTKTIEKVTSESTRLKVDIKSSERNIVKKKATITKLELDIKTSENTMIKLKEENVELEKHASGLLQEQQELCDSISKHETTYHKYKTGFAELDKKISALKSSRVDVEQEFNTITKNIKENIVALTHIKTKLSKLELEEIPDYTDAEHNTLKIYTNEELERLDMKDLEYRQGLLSTDLQNTRPNLQAIEEYKNKNVQYLTRVTELEKFSDERNELRTMIDKISKERHDNFVGGFKIISLKLKELYQIISMGGDAELDLVDTMLPFADGVAFNVRPRKKSWKAISDLSGGEKTLASLCLVLALHYYRPSPLYVMDEIDAALDFRNVSIVANYIKDRTRNAQFIIISLRNNMFDNSDRFICIHKTNDCTKYVALDNNDVYKGVRGS